MAKKKKKEPKEVFKVPEFDEIEFMKTEMDNAKAAIITILYAIPIAIISFELTIFGLAVLGFVVGIFAIFMLKFVYTKLGINIKDFEKKTWLGNGALMFFTWLLFWILMLNPPFSDSADPSITRPEVWVEGSDGNPVKWDLEFRNGQYITDPIGQGKNITLSANVSDNAGIASVTITLAGSSITGESMKKSSNQDHPYKYEFDYTLGMDGFYEFTIRAVDTNNNVNEFKFTVQVV